VVDTNSKGECEMGKPVVSFDVNKVFINEMLSEIDEISDPLSRKLRQEALGLPPLRIQDTPTRAVTLIHNGRSCLDECYVCKDCEKKLLKKLATLARRRFKS
jgi:hypothetical protein